MNGLNDSGELWEDSADEVYFRDGAVKKLNN